MVTVIASRLMAGSPDVFVEKTVKRAMHTLSSGSRPVQ